MPKQKREPRVLNIPIIGKWPKLTDAAQKALAFMTEQENDSNDNDYFPHGWVDKYGDRRKATTLVCHADLDSYKGAKAVYTYFPHSPGQMVPVEVEKKFVDYLMHRSPWKKVPISVSKDFAWEKGFVLEDMTVPANLLGNFCVVSRMCGERPNAILLWNDMVKAGANESVALLLALGITLEGDYHGYGKAMGWAAMDRGHDPFNAKTMTKEYAENFVHGIVANPNQPFGVNPQYQPCNIVWGPCEVAGNTYKKFLYDTYTPAEKKDNRVFQVGGQRVGHGFDRDRWIEIAVAESIRMGVKNVKRRAAARVG